jgi:hypothetical protein
MMIRNHCGLSLLLALGLLGGCGDKGGSDDDEAGTEESATEESATDEVGTESATETADTAEAETTEADTNEAETTEADTNEAETTDADTNDTETDAETGNAGCADLETADECTAMAGCQVVNGSPLKQNGPDAPCLEASEFLGCISEQGCGDAETWFCQGNGMFLVPDTCGPDGADPCDGPADPVSECP